MKNLILLAIILQLCIFVICKKVSVQKSLVFGPGLNADVVVPVRYIYVQAVDTKGKNYTQSPGKDTFTFTFTGKNNERIRVWRDTLDRNDGSFILRFRMYESYKDIDVEIKHGGKHVAKSPYTIKGTSYHEQCNCPVLNRTQWTNLMSCPDSHKLVEESFKTFPTIDLEMIRTEGIRRFGKDHAMCHYQIIRNEVYRKCYGEHVGFAQFSDAWFLSLARKVRLPNIEFLFNLGDWPLSKKGQPPIPVISWGGEEDAYDLVIPTYDLTESVLETLGRVTLDMMSVQGNTGPRWIKKTEKALFRGRDSRQERLDLTVMGRAKPELFDVGLTNFFFFEHDEKKYGPKNQHISFFDFFKYKYQLNVDGTVAAYRFPYLLIGDSVVLKQDSPYYEHFYSELTPWKHYIPFNRDLSNLEEMVLWAKKNDAEARKIGLAGQTFARDNLMSDKLYCYTFKVFQEYAKRQNPKPKRQPGMEHIAQPSGDESKCQCMRTKKKKKHDEL